MYIQSIYIGDIICNLNQKIKTIGWGSYLKNFKINDYISQIEYFYLTQSQYVRSKGTFGLIIGELDNNKFIIKFNSKKTKLFNKWSNAILGKIGLILKKNSKYKKAGFSRNKGKRPTVRGVAMNPVDHPHGGGEGWNPREVAHQLHLEVKLQKV